MRHWSLSHIVYEEETMSRNKREPGDEVVVTSPVSEEASNDPFTEPEPPKPGSISCWEYYLSMMEYLKSSTEPDVLTVLLRADRYVQPRLDQVRWVSEKATEMQEMLSSLAFRSEIHVESVLSLLTRAVAISSTASSLRAWFEVLQRQVDGEVVRLSQHRSIEARKQEGDYYSLPLRAIHTYLSAITDSFRYELIPMLREWASLERYSEHSYRTQFLRKDVEVVDAEVLGETPF